MKTISFLLICLFFSSCLTVKRIEKNCDKFAAVCVIDSKTVIEYRDTTIYKDRVIEVKLPADTVFIEKPVYIKENFCFMDYTRKTFGNIWASAKIENSILDLKAGYVKNIIQVPIRDTIYLEKAITNTTTDNTVTVVKKFIPKFYRFTFAFFIALLAALLAGGITYFIIKYKTYILRIFKK